MEAIKLTNKKNEEVFINLDKVKYFKSQGRGTRVAYDNGQIIDVKESVRIVEYLLEHYVFEVGIDDICH